MMNSSSSGTTQTSAEVWDATVAPISP